VDFDGPFTVVALGVIAAQEETPSAFVVKTSRGRLLPSAVNFQLPPSGVR
jgi:hypothetical protein